MPAHHTLHTNPWSLFMNRFVLVLPLLATAAMSTHAQTFVDSARVRNVQPQYETVAIPRQECSSQWINETHRVDG